jgi:hypothetical protein
MNRHEQIQKIINNEDFFRGDTLGMNNYINSCKATENKLHQVEIENITLKLYREKYIELQRDVKRYFELIDKTAILYRKDDMLTDEEYTEACNLETKLIIKLSKVGVEE